jgi:hypothetical protein
MFKVNDISQLYSYDLQQMRINKINFRKCVDCGKAFIANTSAKRCLDCRKFGNEKQKRVNQKNDRVRNLLNNRIRARNYKRKGTIYFRKLMNYITRLKEEYSGDELLQKAEVLNNIDLAYWDLDEYISNLNDNEIRGKWNRERFTIFDENNPEKWFLDWCKKARFTKTSKKYKIRSS